MDANADAIYATNASLYAAMSAVCSGNVNFSIYPTYHIKVCEILVINENIQKCLENALLNHESEGLEKITLMHTTNIDI